MSHASPGIDEMLGGPVKMPHANRKPSRSMVAFISAPSSLDTNYLRESLERRGFGVLTSEACVVPGMGLREAIDESIRESDLVVLIMATGFRRDEFFFEAGYASALGKRLLVLAPPEEDLGSFQLPYTRARPDNREGIEFGLDQVLHAPRATDRVVEPARKTRPIGDLADSFLARLAEANRLRDWAELESIIREVLTASQVAAMSSSRGLKERDIEDLVVWIDDAEPWFANPLLIQVRMGLQSRADLTSSVDRLLASMKKGDVPSGMLLFGSSLVPWKTGQAMDRNVLVMPAEDLIRGLRDRGLGELLSHLRTLPANGGT